MTNLEWCIRKLTEVALDLREPQTGANLEHQAWKVDEVIKRLQVPDEPEATPQDGPPPNVHGGGTGNQ